MEKKSKYYAVKSLTLAHAIQFVTNESFYKFQNDDGSTVYSFVRTEKFMKSLAEILKLKESNQ